MTNQDGLLQLLDAKIALFSQPAQPSMFSQSGIFQAAFLEELRELRTAYIAEKERIVKALEAKRGELKKEYDDCDGSVQWEAEYKRNYGFQLQGFDAATSIVKGE